MYIYKNHRQQYLSDFNVFVQDGLSINIEKIRTKFL